MEIRKSLGLKLVVVALFYIVFCGASQTDEIDSLKNQLQETSDNNAKVDLLNQISYKVFVSNPEEAVRYGQEAKELSENIDYPSGLAYALKNIGLGYYMKGEFIEVLNYWNGALATFREMDDLNGEANILNNLGAIYYNQGNDAKAIEFYLESLAVAEQINDTLRIATALINVGGVYNNKMATLNKALDYYLRAVPLGEDLKDKGVIGTASLNIGDIYLDQNKDSIALVYLEKSKIAWEGTNRVANSLSKIGTVYARNGGFDAAIRHQQEAIEIARKSEAKLELVRCLIAIAETYELKGEHRTALTYYKEAEKTGRLIGANYELQDTYKGISGAYSALSDFMNAYKYQSLLLGLKDTLFNIETDDKIKGLQFTYEMDKKQGEIDLLTKDKQLQDLQLKKQKMVKNTFLGGLILILIIAFIILRNYKAKVRVNKILDKQKAEIENLVLNILPASVARELQESGAATPRKYDSVSVLFTDFKDFTRISAQLSPAELVAELNEYFMVFDEITEKYGLEKIKTIGDAYMCAGGLPTENESHALDTIRAAFEMMSFMEQKRKHISAKNGTPWELRVGIHTGPLMAGVVGKKKYAYDIWGSTVNVASRMEANSEPGRINISKATYKQIKDEYVCIHRGRIMAKNVGEIDMYFVENSKAAQNKQLNERNG